MARPLRNNGSRLDAHAAIDALQAARAGTKWLLLIGDGLQVENELERASDRVGAWSGRGALLGGALGLLFGGALSSPAIGAGLMEQLAGWIVAVLQSAVVGGATGVLAAALTSRAPPNHGAASSALVEQVEKFMVFDGGGRSPTRLLRRVSARTCVPARNDARAPPANESNCPRPHQCLSGAWQLQRCGWSGLKRGTQVH